ncbi:MAG: hypothetical protein P8N49_02175, partial [Opitutales bacterium]|nr:hypothetical protein [Opitutales bacterium]
LKREGERFIIIICLEAKFLCGKTFTTFIYLMVPFPSKVENNVRNTPICLWVDKNLVFPIIAGIIRT